MLDCCFKLRSQLLGKCLDHILSACRETWSDAKIQMLHGKHAAHAAEEKYVHCNLKLHLQMLSKDKSMQLMQGLSIISFIQCQLGLRSPKGTD